MTYNKIKKKIKKYYKKEKKVIEFNDNIYTIYKKYLVFKVEDYWAVVFKNNPESLINAFDTSSSALGWCLLHYDKRFDEAHGLIYYDNIIQTKKQDIKQFKGHIEINDDEKMHCVLFSRIIETIHQYKIIMKLIDKLLCRYKSTTINGS